MGYRSGVVSAAASVAAVAQLQSLAQELPHAVPKKKKKYCLKIPVDLLSLSVKWGLAFIIYKMGMMTTMPQRGWGASLFPSSDWKQRP